LPTSFLKRTFGLPRLASARLKEHAILFSGPRSISVRTNVDGQGPWSTRGPTHHFSQRAFFLTQKISGILSLKWL
jgi:hypothetical protein